MLRIIQNSASASAKSYYAHSDYLSEGQELTGRWGGRTAQMLGLEGDVDKLGFDRLCDNLDPRSGKQLTLRTNSGRTIGDDFNFHLQKGVSLVYILGEDERIFNAFSVKGRHRLSKRSLIQKFFCVLCNRTPSSCVSLMEKMVATEQAVLLWNSEFIFGRHDHEGIDDRIMLVTTQATISDGSDAGWDYRQSGWLWLRMCCDGCGDRCYRSTGCLCCTRNPGGTKDGTGNRADGCGKTVSR